MSNSTYSPISCDFHSELELRALQRRPIPIRYRNDEDAEITVFTSIKDLYTRKGEEFLLLPDGSEIRLDRLVSVDGLELAEYVCK